MEEIGTGVLDWDREERISDRYGMVMLFDRPHPPRKAIRLRRSNEGKHGRLVAVVRETREPSHVGDLFHGISPSKPTVDEIVVLGEGRLFFFVDAVGLFPDDNRATLWLDIHTLYRVHNQTITLIFEGSESDAISNDIISRTSLQLVEIANRILRLAQEVADENVSPDEVSAQTYAEAECLRQISDELKE